MNQCLGTAIKMREFDPTLLKTLWVQRFTTTLMLWSSHKQPLMIYKPARIPLCMQARSPLWKSCEQTLFNRLWAGNGETKAENAEELTYQSRRFNKISLHWGCNCASLLCAEKDKHVAPKQSMLYLWWCKTEYLITLTLWGVKVILV